MRSKNFNLAGNLYSRWAPARIEKAARGILPSRASERSVNVRSPARESVNSLQIKEASGHVHPDELIDEEGGGRARPQRND